MGKKQDEFNVKKWVDDCINEEVDQAREDFDIDAITEADPEEGAERLFHARSKAVKTFSKDLQRSLQYLKKEYRKELNFSKENVFPRDWMKKDMKIRVIIGYKDKKDSRKDVKPRYPLFIPLLNYLHNLTRGTKPANDVVYRCTSKLMINGYPFDAHKTDTVDDYQISAFVTDRDFHKAISNDLGYAEITIKKHIRGMLHEGLLYKLGNVGNAQLLCDGYFAGSYNTKHSSITNCKDTRRALQRFKPI